MTRRLQVTISGVNNDPRINILDKVESIITQSSITFTELEDCMHEYLRLLMSGVFNDNKFTILNVWNKQWYQYQHSWRSEVTHILKSRILNECSRQWSQHPDSLQNSIIFTELEDYMHESLRLWMNGVFHDQKLQFWISGVNGAPSIQTLYGIL